MSNGDKFEAILGFAKRAGKIVYGYDDLRLSKRVKLYAVCDSASDNLADGIKALARKNGKPLVIAARKAFTDGNCKAVGITDAHMAEGMLDYIGQGTELYGIYRFTEDR